MPAMLDAKAALDRHFLETRCKIIEIAANLDRIDRGGGAPGVRSDPRLARIKEALRALLDEETSRAERCQMIFSLRYDESWKPPNG